VAVRELKDVWRYVLSSWNKYRRSVYPVCLQYEYFIWLSVMLHLLNTSLSLCELTTHNTITKNCLKLVANELLHWEYQIPFLFLLAKAFFFVDIPKVFRKNVISVIIFSEPLVKYSLHSWSHMFKGLDCSVLFNSVLRLKEIICIQSKKRGETANIDLV
jgi:hypothetical protein